MSHRKQTMQKYNIMTLGNSAVGKTSFIIRYTENTFKEVYLTTLGIDYKTKVVKMKNKKSYMINFFDTAGQEKYKSISINVIKNANGILLMYDITNKSSFESISNWMKNIIEIKGNNFPVILVGNKTDLIDKREVSTEEGENIAQKYGIKFFEISNKYGTNVEEAGLELINQVVENNSNLIESENNNAVKINTKNLRKKEKDECKC